MPKKSWSAGENPFQWPDFVYFAILTACAAWLQLETINWNVYTRTMTLIKYVPSAYMQKLMPQLHFNTAMTIHRRGLMKPKWLRSHDHKDVKNIRQFWLGWKRGRAIGYHPRHINSFHDYRDYLLIPKFAQRVWGISTSGPPCPWNIVARSASHQKKILVQH